MIAALILSSIASAAVVAAPANFTVSVTISQAGEAPKQGSVSFAGGHCTSMNGPLKHKHEAKICKALGEQIAREEKTYTVMPWINNPDVPSFVVTFKNSKSSWTRETGLIPDKDSKPREALRLLAVKVLETAK